MRDRIIEIKSGDYWVKIVDFLQQNWAVIEPCNDKIIVYFFGDTAGVFDEIEFENIEKARRALRKNGFRLYDEDKNIQTFIAKPIPPFWESGHPNGKIYSSGRFWH